jgi:hypothetical protein
MAQRSALVAGICARSVCANRERRKRTIWFSPHPRPISSSIFEIEVGIAVIDFDKICSSASTPALIRTRNAFSLNLSSRRRYWSARSASRAASFAFWYSPDLTTLSTKASCSALRLMFRVGMSDFSWLVERLVRSAQATLDVDGIGSTISSRQQSPTKTAPPYPAVSSPPAHDSLAPDELAAS